MTFQFPSQHHRYNWSPGIGPYGSNNGDSRRSGEMDRETAKQTLDFLATHNISHPRKADQVQPGVYLGDLRSAQDRHWLAEKHITHILTVCHCPELEVHEKIKRKVVDVADASDEDLLDHFKNCWRFISNAIDDGGRLLIHCEQGVSRSPTVLAVFMMKSERLHSSEALARIKRFRPIIDPNEGFKQQLHIWGQCRGELEGKIEYISWKETRVRRQLKSP